MITMRRMMLLPRIILSDFEFMGFLTLRIGLTGKPVGL
jgi:hypothetical protein